MKDSIKKSVLITGGTGFIGSVLVEELVKQGYQCWVLTRHPENHTGNDSLSYFHSLSEVSNIPFYAVFNLAGEPLAAKRWNQQRKDAFVASRINMTKQLYAHFKQLGHTPSVIINASAIGYYGCRGNERLDESSSAGSGFAADLCKAWEDCASSFEQLGSRLCIARIGVVLDNGGGAFTEIRRSFDMKIASRIGHGQQWFSWIHRKDMVNALLFMMENEKAKGIFNGTAPEPVTNQVLTNTLSKALKAWIKLPMPAFAMRTLVGEMADELLLEGQHVSPKRLQALEFQFEFPTLTAAIQDILIHE